MRWARVLLLLLGLAAPLRAQDAAAPDAPSPAAPEVVVRQSLDPASGAVIGQHVALSIDVLFAGDMPRPPRVSVPDVPGLQVFRFETQGLTLRETLAGQAYVGQRFEFALYARRGGSFEIPPVAVTLLDRQGAPKGTAQGEAVALEVTVPPGVDPSGPVVATRRLTLTEQWQPDPNGTFKPGDAVVRTVTRTAEDVPGFAMRDLAFAAPAGVRAYADPPDIADQSNRGVLTGRRTDRVTYVFERGGQFDLPAVAQPWWDLGAGALKSAEGAGSRIEVTAAPPPESAAPGWTRIWLLAIAAAAACALIVDLWRRRRGRAHDVERDAFAALGHACRCGAAEATYAAFVAWRRWLPPCRWSAANAAAVPLDAALFSPEASSWGRKEGTELLRRLEALRRTAPARRHAPSLTPLNPYDGQASTTPEATN